MMNTLTKVLGPAVRIGVGAVLGCYLTAGCRPASTTAQQKPDADGNPPAHVARTHDGEAEVTFDAETQGRIGLKVATLTEETYRPETVAYGALEEDASRVFTLRAPVAGVVRAQANRDWPSLGESIAADTVVGWIELRLGPVEQVDLATRASQARADADEAAAALAAARASYENKKALNAGQKVVSDRALEEAEAKVKSEEARARSAARIIELLDFRQSAEEGILRMPLRIGQDGEVAEVGIRPGEAVEAGRVLLKVARYDALLARVELPVGDAFDPTSTSARIIPMGFESSSLVGARVAQAAATEARSRGSVLLFRVNCGSLPLRPGATVLAYLPAPGGGQSGVEIPRSAVVRSRGHAWAYVQSSDDSFVRREVPVAQATERGWFTASGFTPGDRVVIEGAHALLSEELKPEIEREEVAVE